MRSPASRQDVERDPVVRRAWIYVDLTTEADPIQDPSRRRVVAEHHLVPCRRSACSPWDARKAAEVVTRASRRMEQREGGRPAGATGLIGRIRGRGSRYSGDADSPDRCAAAAANSGTPARPRAASRPGRVVGWRRFAAACRLSSSMTPSGERSSWSRRNVSGSMTSSPNGSVLEAGKSVVLKVMIASAFAWAAAARTCRSFGSHLSPLISGRWR